MGRKKKKKAAGLQWDKLSDEVKTDVYRGILDTVAKQPSTPGELRKIVSAVVKHSVSDRFWRRLIDQLIERGIVSRERGLDGVFHVYLEDEDFWEELVLQRDRDVIQAIQEYTPEKPEKPEVRGTPAKVVLEIAVAAPSQPPVAVVPAFMDTLAPEPKKRVSEAVQEPLFDSAETPADIVLPPHTPPKDTVQIAAPSYSFCLETLSVLQRYAFWAVATTVLARTVCSTAAVYHGDVKHNHASVYGSRASLGKSVKLPQNLGLLQSHDKQVQGHLLYSVTEHGWLFMEYLKEQGMVPTPEACMIERAKKS